MCLNCDRDACTGCKGDEGEFVSISPEMHEAIAQEVKKLHEVLHDLIEDFDQTGCSDDMGTVMTRNINAARALLGMELLDDGEEHSEDEDEEPVSA